MFSYTEQEVNGKTLVWADGEFIGSYKENGEEITATALNGKTETWTIPYHNYHGVRAWLQLNK